MSLKAAVSKAHKQLKEGVRSIRMEPVHNEHGEPNGHMLTHEMHDYEHEENHKNYHMKSPSHVAKHMKGCKYCGGSASMGKEEDGKVEDEE